MEKKKISFEYTEYSGRSELNESLRNLLEHADNTRKKAYAPYSNYLVGAAVLLDNGEIVTGSNQENMAYPSGLCAERIAVFHAASRYPDSRMKAIAISGDARHFEVNHPVTPCGACRQVIAEYEIKQKNPIQLVLAGEKGKVFVVESIENLLPLQFRADELKKH